MPGSARGTRMLAGIAAAAVALGGTQLLAVPFGSQADARTAVGSAVIDLTPGPVKEWAIQIFGMADKLFLSVIVIAVIAAIAAITARWETRRAPVGSIAIVAAGVVGCAAVLSRAGATAADLVPTIVGTVCGVAVLRLLTSGRLKDEPDDDGAGDTVDRGRRLSLVSLGFLAVGVLSGGARCRCAPAACRRSPVPAPPSRCPGWRSPPRRCRQLYSRKVLRCRHL